MSAKIALALILVQISIPAGSASAETGRCERLLAKFRGSVKEMAADFSATRGFSIFGRRMAPERRYPDHGGFLSRPSPRQWFITWALAEAPLRVVGIRDRQLSPFSGLYHQLIASPFSVLSERLGMGSREPTLITLVLLSYLAGGPLTDASWKSAYDLKAEYRVRSNPSAFEDLLRHDFSYRDIETSYDKGDLTYWQALRAVFWRRLAQEQYYHSRLGKVSDRSIRTELSYLPMFGELQNVVMNGVSPRRGYIVPEDRTGPLPPDRVVELIEDYHALYAKYLIISTELKDKSQAEEFRTSPYFAGLRETLLADPFNAYLFRLSAGGELSTGDAQEALQEYAFWQCRFEVMEALGIRKLRTDPYGHLTNRPLTIDDIKAEILSTLLPKAGTNEQPPA